MSTDRDSTSNRQLTRAEIEEQVASRRTVGGVYDVVAYWVEYDNLPHTGPLSPVELDALARLGVSETALNNHNTAALAASREDNEL